MSLVCGNAAFHSNLILILKDFSRQFWPDRRLWGLDNVGWRPEIWSDKMLQQNSGSGRKETTSGDRETGDNINNKILRPKS